MASDDVQIIKEKLDLVEYLKPIVALKPSGKNWSGLCPFHKEKTPSFMVSPERQTWHCFGSCSAGGDLFSFVMKYENVEFYEALKLLAERAGVHLRSSAGADWQRYDRLYEINRAAADFFQQTLTGTPAARQYLQERGLTDETIAEFEIGAAVNSSDALLRHLTQSRFTPEDIERAGLIFRTDRGTYWDRFRQRLMFPLHNPSGKVIGFTGRVLEGVNASANSGMALAKYVNSPETPLFQKSKFLYGFHKSKNGIRDGRRAVLVEGQMDFLLSWQDGLKNVVASSGTALTNDQLIVLRRSAETLALAFDSDEAGQAAIERSIDLAMTHEFAVTVVALRSAAGAAAGKDPADIVRGRPGLLAELVAAAQPAMRHYFSRYLTPTADIFQQKKQVRAVLAKIENIPSSIERSAWLRELALTTGIGERVLLEELEGLPRSAGAAAAGAAGRRINPAPAASDGPPAAASRADRIATRLFGVVYHDRGLFRFIADRQDFFPVRCQPLFGYFSGEAAAVDQSLLDAISFQPAGSEAELFDLLHQLDREFYHHRQRTLQAAIRQAEQGGDAETLNQVMREFDLVSRKLHTQNTHGSQKTGASETTSEDSETEDNF